MFKKVSTLENKNINFYNELNYKIKAFSFDNSLGNKTNLSNIALFQNRDTDLSKNSIQIDMDKTDKSFECTISNLIYNLVYNIEFNGKTCSMPEKLPVKSNFELSVPENLVTDTYYNSYKINFVKSTPIIIEGNKESYIFSNTENSITKFRILNQSIVSIKMNVPSIEQLIIDGGSSLTTFYPGKFKALQYFSLQDTNINGPLVISKLDNNATINILNDGIQYLEIEGSNNVFTSETLKINDPKLRYIRFINCEPDEECLLSLINNCPLIIEKDPQTQMVTDLNIEKVIR